MAALAPDQPLDRRFTLIRPLGEGGTGEVWLVEDRELEEQVVIKLVPSDASPDRLALLKRECRNARRLVHPDIVRVYDLHHEDPYRFISMAYVKGDDIGRLRGRPLPEILKTVLPVADALDYAHRQGVVHRDLKSTNVLLDTAGQPQLVDFGIAGLLGTPSDELVGGRATPADDIYGFGALLYELLSDCAEPLPQKLASLLTALLSEHADDRHESMRAVKDSIQDVQRELKTDPVASRPSKKPVIIAPPPLVARGEPLHPEMPPSMAPRPSETSPGGIGWLTITAFAFLIGATAAVFLFLPRWAPRPDVENTRRDVLTDDAPPPSSVAAPTEPAQTDQSLQHQAELKTRAEDLREDAIGLREALDAKRASLWGGGAYGNALASIRAGEEQLRARTYQDAAETYAAAIARLREVETQGQAVLREALADGGRALEAGDSPAAIAAFELAASLEPGNGVAATGLSRARVLNELVRLLAGGAEHERRGDLAQARESYRGAVSLDGHSQKARLALARAEGNIREVAFRTAMSEGLAALNRQDDRAAFQFFQQAGTIKSADPQVAAGIAQAEEDLRSRRSPNTASKRSAPRTKSNGTEPQSNMKRC